MTSTVNVLLVETDELELRERIEQLLMDGYAVDSVSAVDQARVKLAESPDALVVSSGPETIGLLRELRAGEMPRADSRLPVLVVGVDDDSAAVRYYRAGADVALPSEKLRAVGGGGARGAWSARRPAGDAGSAGREPDRRPRREDGSGGQPAGEADPA